MTGPGWGRTAGWTADVGSCSVGWLARGRDPFYGSNRVATLGHWVQAEDRRAGDVLVALDPAGADRVEILALDEIFFGATDPTGRV